MADNVKVIGARRLRSTLKKAGADMKDLNAIHKQAAQLVATATRAPVRTGRLQGTVRAAGTRTAGIVRAGYQSVPYANPTHWGWPRRNIKANPFLSDAATSTESQWIQLYEDEIERLVDSVNGA